jgi:small subunit ribosomal protein S6
MNPTQRKYRATFILDNRGKEDTIDQIVEGVKKVIAEVKGEVTGFENLGRRDFVRVTDKKLTAATYVHIDFSGPASAPAGVHEKLRLNQSVYRTFVRSA